MYNVDLSYLLYEKICFYVSKELLGAILIVILDILTDVQTDGRRNKVIRRVSTLSTIFTWEKSLQNFDYIHHTRTGLRIRFSNFSGSGSRSGFSPRSRSKKECRNKSLFIRKKTLKFWLKTIKKWKNNISYHKSS